MIPHKNGNHAEQNQKQNDDEQDEAVARDALFVAHRAQAVDAAGGEIIHEARIVRRRAAEMVAQSVPQRGQVVFADAEFVVAVARVGFGLE